MSVKHLPTFIKDNYEVHEWRHALAILRADFPGEWDDICDILTRFRLKKSWIVVGGGRKSKVSEWIDSQLLNTTALRYGGPSSSVLYTTP